MSPAPAATVSAGALGADAGRANRPAPDAALTRGRFRLSGLHCATCAGLVESLLQAQRGVRSAEVQPATQTLMLDWRPELVTLAQRQLRVTVIHHPGPPYGRGLRRSTA